MIRTVHIAGLPVGSTTTGMLRQRCAWCGALLHEERVDTDAVVDGKQRPCTFKPYAFIEEKGGALREVSESGDDNCDGMQL